MHDVAQDGRVWQMSDRKTCSMLSSTRNSTHAASSLSAWLCDNLYSQPVMALPARVLLMKVLGSSSLASYEAQAMRSTLGTESEHLVVQSFQSLCERAGWRVERRHEEQGVGCFGMEGIG